MRSSGASRQVWFRVPHLHPSFGELPDQPESYWAWLSGQPNLDAWGPFSWTLQTCLQLIAHGHRATLTREIPDEGVIIAHRDFLPDDLTPSPGQLVVCILADRGEPTFRGRHPWAHIHIVQNPRDPMVLAQDELWPAQYMPYWPQPGMIPRSTDRGNRFTNAAFFGYAHNLAPEMLDDRWIAQLDALGIEWSIPHRSRWHDYRAVDVVIAARSFGDRRDYTGKPPSKLHNAWLAGVPAILGRESAFRAVREHDLDYIEVDSASAAVDAVQRLQQDPGLRAAMVRHGLTRADPLRPSVLSARWNAMIQTELVPALTRWHEFGTGARTRFFEARRMAEEVSARDRASGSTYVPQILSAPTPTVEQG